MYLPVFGQLRGGSVTFFACEASCASLGTVPVIGTSKALSSADGGLFSTFGISPSISKASMASLVSVDVAGVSTVFNLGAVVSLVDGWGSAIGLDAASESFLMFLFLTGLGRCVGFVVNLDLYLSVAIRCLDGLRFRSTSRFFLGGVGGHQHTPPRIVCSLLLFEGDWMFALLLLCQSDLHRGVCFQALRFQ